MRKMAISVDAFISQLNPIRLATNLLKVCDDTVFVCNVWTRTAGQCHVIDAGDIWQLSCGLDLDDTAAICGFVNAYGFQD